MNEAQPRERNEPDFPTIRTKPSAGDSFGSAGGSRVNYPSEAIAQTVGNLALKPQADVLEFKLRPAPKLEAVPEVKSEPKQPKRTSKPKAVKTESTKEDADWLANSFPAKVKGAAGRWAVINHGAGFEVYFRVDKRQNNGEPINLKFPRISREMFLTLKGMSDAERKITIEKYVRGFIVKTIAEGDDRARVVAGKLRSAS